ncbi:cytochrome c [Paenalkalicoccus suaedae]|uniref:Cytochrome c n=1 Tax=Paenalkalicoccus suaedae TaxID=2592382 RepID=A0A859FF67_9BACI|nr:cytochrome c [Paenalkalicoccus suaedae]QKS70876.1 cytochrome c [Paenalkalicoccus suaedae]
MRGAPLFPFAVTAFLGLLLILSLSLVGINIGDDLAGGNENGEGNAEQQEFDDPIELGQSVYEMNCASCHGGNLEGGVGPALDGGNYSQEEILSAIAEGPGSMPAGLASGEEADAVAEFILSVSE